MGADRELSPWEFRSEVRRLTVTLRTLPAIEAHCLARGSEPPPTDEILERARAYVACWDRDKDNCRACQFDLRRAVAVLRQLLEDFDA